MPPVTRREILRLALPAMASAVLGNCFRVIDQYAAGHISTAAQAGIGSCIFVLIANYGMHLLIAGGVGPVVARATGAGDAALARRATGTALVAALTVALLVGAPAAFFSDAIAAGLGLTGDTRREAATFLRWLLGLGMPLAVGPVIDAVLIARGKTGAMMALQVLAAALNFGLNVWLIQRVGMGVAGAALATVLSRVTTGALGVWLLHREVGLGIARDDTLRRMLRVGWPVASNYFAYSAVYFLLLRIAISPLGPEANAALGIGFSALEGFTYPMFLGLSVAVSGIVGRRLGAGEPEEAARAARLAFPLATAMGVAAGMLFWFGARPLCGLFTTDPAILEAAVVYSRALAWSQLAVSWEALAEGVLGGAGDSRTIFWLSAPVNAVRVPLGWLMALPLGLGANGVWWAINVTSWGKALGKGIAAARGRWVRVRV